MRLLDVLNAPWAIVPEKLLEIREIYFTHLRGEKIDLRRIEARMGRPLHNEHLGYTVEDGVAVLSLEGVIAKRMNMFTQISGGVSTQLAARDFQAALDDPSVHSILLHVESPGGEVDGTQAFADLIHQARGRKPIVALADGLMASAAYWIGSAADKVYITGDTTAVGSIGIVATHTDYSRREEQMGVKVTEITAGKYKRIASEHAPLTEEGRASIKEQVDHVYSVFVDTVARNRGTDSETVLKDMADGRMFLGKQAIEAGLVDGVSSLGAIVSQLNQQHQQATAIGAVAPNPTPKGGAMADEKTATVEVGLSVLSEEDIQKREAEAYGRGKTEGAAAERERIKAVESNSMPGHEALIQEMKWDGKTTGPEAAVRILRAVQEKNAQKLKDLKADAPDPVTASTAPDKETAGKVDVADIASKAQAYVAEQAQKGIKVSYAQAVEHVMTEAGLPLK